MKIKTLKFLSVLSAAVILMPSCNSDDTDSITDQTLAQCLTYSVDVTTKAQSFNKISFTAQYNYSNSTVDLGIIGMVLPKVGNSDGIAFPKMQFRNLPWRYNSAGWKVIDVENVKPEIAGMSEVPTFNELQFCLADIFSESGYTPGIMYDFEIDSRYDVKGCCMSGTTKSISPEGEVYSPESDSQATLKPTYLVELDFNESTADIYLYSAKFLGSMPSLNLEFPDVPYSIKNGKIELECASLTPEYNGRPFPSFPITQLKGTLDYSAGMKLDFHCGFRGADYTVNIDCKY